MVNKETRRGGENGSRAHSRLEKHTFIKAHSRSCRSIFARVWRVNLITLPHVGFHDWMIRALLCFSSPLLDSLCAIYFNSTILQLADVLLFRSQTHIWKQTSNKDQSGAAGEWWLSWMKNVGGESSQPFSFSVECLNPPVRWTGSQRSSSSMNPETTLSFQMCLCLVRI